MNQRQRQRALSSIASTAPSGVVRRRRVARAVVFAAIGWVSGGLGCARQTPRVGDELRELVSFLREVHPGPRNDSAIDTTLRAEAEALDEGADARLVAAAIHRTLAVWNDAHLMAGLPASTATDAVSLVPVLPVRVGGRVLVDAAAPPLPLGTELVALEGRPVVALLDELSRYAPVDGGSPRVREAIAERDFTRLAYLELGMQNTYAVTVRRPNGALESLELRGLDGPQKQALDGARWSLPRSGVTSADGSAWPFVVELDAGTRLLRLPTFAVNALDEYRARIDGIFEGFRGDERLVLDVRGNAGGIRHHGVAVLRHVLERPFTQWTRVETRVLAIPDEYRPRVDFLVGSEQALRGFPWKKTDDRWVFEGDPLVELMTPVGDVHRGPVMVFIDDATNSAAVEMIVALRAHRPSVVVIGAETRGGCGRHTGELPVVFETPDSAVPVIASLFEIALVPDDRCVAGRGVQPDVEVTYDEAAFLEGRDPYLDALGALDAAPN